MEKEKKAREKADQEASTYAPPTETYIKSTKLQDVTGVFYRCPIAGPAVLPKVYSKMSNVWHSLLFLQAIQ